MEPEAIFVNVARGDILGEDALIVIPDSGKLRGVGLDVHVSKEHQ
jgi:phosphoglycerate dehydrogenase-like enzyme